MKNKFIYLFILLFSLVFIFNSPNVFAIDLAENNELTLLQLKSIYSVRITNKINAVENKINNIVPSLGNVEESYRNELITELEYYRDSIVTPFLNNINTATSKQQLLNTVNATDISTMYTTLIYAILYNTEINEMSEDIKNSYGLINDTNTYVNINSSGNNNYVNNLLAGAGKQVDIFTNFFKKIVKNVYALPSGQWTCRQYDGDFNNCAKTINLKKESCFWDKKTNKCVGDNQGGIEMAQFDKSLKDCEKYCDWYRLENCYQGEKCVLNQELEEYVKGEIIAALCGNEIIDSGEECDKGDENGTKKSFCNKDCTKRYLDEPATKLLLDQSTIDLNAKKDFLDLFSLDISRHTINVRAVNLKNKDSLPVLRYNLTQARNIKPNVKETILDIIDKVDIIINL